VPDGHLEIFFHHILQPILDFSRFSKIFYQDILGWFIGNTTKVPIPLPIGRQKV